MVIEDAESAIAAQLAPEEHLFWIGQPRPGIRLEPSDLLMVPFSFLWGGFAIFWEISVILAGAPLFFALFGIPFVVVGLYLIVGRFFVDAWQRAHTYYSITDRRILIVCNFLQQSLQSLNLANLTDVSLTERKDGSGTITFGSGTSLFRPFFFSHSQWFGSSRQFFTLPSFRGIENVRGVYEIILKLQSVSHQERPTVSVGSLESRQ